MPGGDGQEVKEEETETLTWPGTRFWGNEETSERDRQAVPRTKGTLLPEEVG